MGVLVTGGAGYIGSHATRVLLDEGHGVTVLDDLSTGHRDAVDPRARFVEGDFGDPRSARNALEGCDAVMHFAAKSIVSESCKAPLKYWSNNVAKTVSFLQAIDEAGVKRFVFSSTAATYGEPAEMPIPETCPQQPINPYGATKLAIERMLADYADATPAFAYAALRYFNVAGCAFGLGERHDPETHLVPIILQTAAGLRAHISIFGTDYDTPDGTCIRDYVHVRDLVDAHLAVLKKLEPGHRLQYNVGTGAGCSVREMIDAARSVTGADFEVKEAPRRAGDPPALVTDTTRIEADLGWRATRSSPQTILTDHWAWFSEWCGAR